MQWNVRSRSDVGQRALRRGEQQCVLKSADSINNSNNNSSTITHPPVVLGDVRQHHMGASIVWKPAASRSNGGSPSSSPCDHNNNNNDNNNYHTTDQFRPSQRHLTLLSRAFALVNDGNLAELERMMAQEPSLLMCQDSRGISLLHRAVESGRENIVLWLLEKV